LSLGVKKVATKVVTGGKKVISYAVSFKKKSEDRGYNKRFTNTNANLLKETGQYNIRYVRDMRAKARSQTIRWTQFTRCSGGWGRWGQCKETYYLVDYYKDGDKRNPVMRVYVAKKAGGIPHSFSTCGYKDQLHFGFLGFVVPEGFDKLSGMGFNKRTEALFYVIQPNGWLPFQHRFKTNLYTSLVKKSLAIAAKMVAKKYKVHKVMKKFGIKPKDLTASNFGDYLRYIKC